MALVPRVPLQVKIRLSRNMRDRHKSQECRSLVFLETLYFPTAGFVRYHCFDDWGERPWAIK